MTDLCLPKEWGSWLFEQVKAEYPHIPVVLVSGTSELCDASVFDLVVDKPVDMEMLWVQIQKILETQNEKGDSTDIT